MQLTCLLAVLHFVCLTVSVPGTTIFCSCFLLLLMQTSGVKLSYVSRLIVPFIVDLLGVPAWRLAHSSNMFPVVGGVRFWLVISGNMASTRTTHRETNDVDNNHEGCSPAITQSSRGHPRGRSPANQVDHKGRIGAAGTSAAASLEKGRATATRAAAAYAVGDS